MMTMIAKRTTIRDLWITGTLAEIQRALEGSADDEERRGRIDDLAEWIRSKPFSVEEPIKAAVERAVEAEMITEDEAGHLVGQA
jgi:CHASE3 domain sensor protein